MKTIIIPTDFSKNSLRAIDFAFDYFNQKDNHFVLCNFYESPGGSARGLTTLLDQLRKQAEKGIAEIKLIVDKKHEDHLLNLTTIVLQGAVQNEVQNLVSETNADFVIMGTKGASGIKEMLIGSNASNLLKNINIPVFAIPEDYNKYYIKDLFFSYDGNLISRKTAQIIRSFAKSNDLPIELMHVRNESEPPIQNWREVEDLFDNHRTSLHEIYGRSYKEGIQKAIKNEKCILVLIKRKQSIWEQIINSSDSQRVVSHLSVPILVIPD
jgi:nucleotide-binding universal stress UspA family protein